jgi:hypothetical protein
MEPNQTNNLNNIPISPNPSNSANMGSSNTAGNGHKKVGPIVATLVIVIILIAIAIYVFASRINQQAAPIDNGAAMNTSADTSAYMTATPTITPVTGTADDPASLQSDLKASTQGVDAQNF